MSTTNPRAADEATTWRAPPPHLASAPDQAQASFMTAATSQPAENSMAHTPHLPIPSDRSNRTHLSMDRTSSPSSPSGLTASVVTAPSGERYLMENDTQLRVDLRNGVVLTDDEYADLQRRANHGTSPDHRNVPSPAHRSQTYSPVSLTSRSANQSPVSNTLAPGTPAPQSASPMRNGTHSELNGEPLRLIHELVQELSLASTPASAAQINTLNALRGAFTTGRQHLLATTAAAIDQRNSAARTHASLVELKDETVRKLYDLHNDIGRQHSRLDKCIDASIFALRNLGITKDALGDVVKQLADSREKKLAAPYMAGYALLSPPRSLPIPSKRSRVSFLLASPKNRIWTTRAGSTALQTEKPKRPNQPDGLEMNPRIYSTQPNPTLDVFEEFSQEADREIRAIIDRELSEDADVPMRIKPPRLEAPGKFKGQNDHIVFMLWLEVVCTWMQAQFYGGPSAAQYRIVLLKTLIEGPALEWFVDYVESRPGRISEIKYDFASILCALHRRFVTAATAQKASRDFDAVRYSADEGPLKLMDSLMSASRQMREPMTQFMIAQRFLKLLPDKIYDMMLQQRGLSAEYSSIEQLRLNAHQIWSTDPMTRSSARTHTSLQAPRRPTTAPTAKAENIARLPVRPDTSRPGTGHQAHNHAAAGAATTDKRCFKCGVIGHIGSDPICVKHPNHNPKARVGMAAQRVLDTYAEDEFPDEEGDHTPEDGPWGGSQYDPDVEVGDRDPNEAPDLGDLIDLKADENPPRMGAMRTQYFAL
ncbi:hypothetical protein DFH07DRAFT_965698 [Mycena maculata]|uniref:Uncharacterized protein n=1 Tax=Mycena maculata TaxID=230809 RepID=A0AAD7IDZ7_9AGAR|nr:hypothetical protein DFH07DRAFT_965698 [Mycena maculata]